MAEIQENTNKPKTETTKIEGVSAQINLSPGSAVHQRFAKLFKESGAATNRDFIVMLMDNFENPPADADSAATVASLERQLADALIKVSSFEEQIADKDTAISKMDSLVLDLKKQLDEANKTANENALKAQKMLTDTDGAIIVKPNPVSAYFLKEMAEKQNTTPGKILERLFIDDLQNPRANNLPYTVESSRIREVMEELKQKQQQR